RVFVAEKSGLIKVFPALGSTTYTVFADLRTNVHNYWDRGLLGLALHPNFPATPYVYVLYTLDAAPGGTPPRWGQPGATSDDCPPPPGPRAAGCVVGGRLSRLTASGNVMSGQEQVLIEDWCQQYPSHSIGSLAFGADGALYVSAGDGASFNFTDYGQRGNPCGDPPGEGGALRSQDLRTSGDPVGLSGTILRIDPGTGEAWAGNPLGSQADRNAERVIAYGLRNPFRMAVQPGTGELWVGDVGLTNWEEINRIPSPGGPRVSNFGWPCYEGVGRQSAYEAANLDLCKQLYGEPAAVTPPFYTYRHSEQVVAGEPCPAGSSSISGLAFYAGGQYPTAYNGALFFADYSRGCIWLMFERDGVPDPSTRATFLSGAASPVSL